MAQKKQTAKKALLKKMLKGKGKRRGASPLKGMDNGLGKVPLTTPDLTGGAGSNLGVNGIF